METVLNHLDPVLLDDLYGSAFRAAEIVCGATNQTHPDWWSPSSGPSSVIVDKSKEWLCNFAADPRLWQRHGIWRQSISIFFLTWLSSSFFYLLFGTVCYYLHFDRELKKQPKFRPNQIRSEIKASLTALLVFNVLTVPIFVAQVRGWAKIYPFGTGSTWYEVAQYPLFALFSDTWMYWLHRAFHHPVLFKMSHYQHHMYVIPTPFAAYAFEPIEGWIMSLPIYAYSFLWPMSDVGQLVVFFITNMWTFLLHDNRDQFHTVHHKSIQFNFGQFSDMWDRLGGTYADPGVFFDPAREKRGLVKSRA